MMHFILPALTLCLLGTVVFTQNITEPTNSTELPLNVTSIVPTTASPGLNVTAFNTTASTDAAPTTTATTATTTTKEPSPTNSTDPTVGAAEGLSDGAIAGIAIGSIAGVAAVGGGVFGALKFTGRF